MALSESKLERWQIDRDRQSKQHPVDHLISGRISRGEHYRRKNNGVALRTFRAIARWP